VFIRAIRGQKSLAGYFPAARIAAMAAVTPRFVLRDTSRPNHALAVGITRTLTCHARFVRTRRPADRIRLRLVRRREKIAELRIDAREQRRRETQQFIETSRRRMTFFPPPLHLQEYRSARDRAQRAAASATHAARNSAVSEKVSPDGSDHREFGFSIWILDWQTKTLPTAQRVRPVEISALITAFFFQPLARAPEACPCPWFIATGGTAKPAGSASSDWKRNRPPCAPRRRAPISRGRVLQNLSDNEHHTPEACALRIEDGHSRARLADGPTDRCLSPP